MNTIIRPMTAADLEEVLAWRNHLEVRRYMYTQHEISLDEHRQWFESSQSNSLRHLLIFKSGDVSLGFINVTESIPNLVADWGFYLAPQAPKGTGRLLGTSVLKYIFATLHLHKVCGQALGFNERSIRFHLALGFTLEGTLRDQHFDGQCFHDVVHFGLLNEEWQALQREV